MTATPARLPKTDPTTTGVEVFELVLEVLPDAPAPAVLVDVPPVVTPEPAPPAPPTPPTAPPPPVVVARKELEANVEESEVETGEENVDRADDVELSVVFVKDDGRSVDGRLEETVSKAELPEVVNANRTIRKSTMDPWIQRLTRGISAHKRDKT